MPNNNTIESLNIEINGSAKQATEGVGKLIGSLRSLARGVGTVVPALRALNTELKTLGSYGRIKLPSLSATNTGSSVTRAIEQKTKEFKATASVLKEFKGVNSATWQPWRYGPNQLPTITNATGNGGMISDEEMKKLHPEWYRTDAEMAQIALQQATGSENGMSTWAKDTEQATKEIEQFEQKTDEAVPAVRAVGRAVKESSQEMEEGEKKVSKFAKAWSRITRIASTMAIRTALRAIMKGFSESWQAAYQFSSAMNGTFAKSVDAMKTSISDITTSIVQTFAPVLQALVPVFIVISNAVQYLCQGLQWLLSLLGLTSDLMGKSTADINKYAGASKNANKTQKNLLASWDELNIIQSNSGGGGSGGGSGYKPGSIKDMVSDEVGAIMSIIVGEAMLAIGLILCCTGHLGAGIGMMVVGAAAITKTLVADWGKLPKEIKRTIAEIMTIAGSAFLALGLILAFTGHIGLGIGLIAIGAANLVAAVAVTWGEDAVSGIRETVSKIMQIAGASMLALGIILCTFGVIPLGVALIAAGAASIVGSIALNWDGIVERVNGAITSIANWFVDKWNVITGAIGKAWDAIMKWGDENLLQPIRDAWNSVVGFFSTVFGGAETEGSIAHWASGAWDDVSAWWDSSIAKPVGDAWNDVKNFFGTLFGDSSTDGSIAKFASDTWNSVSDWWNTSISKPVGDAWQSVSDFFSDLWGSSEDGTGIAGWAANAWDSVSTWWTTNVTEKVEEEGVWGGIKGFFKGIFVGEDGTGGIVGMFNEMWGVVSQFWSDNIIEPIKTAWKGVKNWFYENVTMPVANFFIDAINGIIEGVNWVIRALNSLHFTIPGIDFLGLHTEPITIGISNIQELSLMERLQPIAEYANGAYGIPQGDLFIANEMGAELVGNINGKTSVANQNQIIDGIRNGVTDANASQNELLREQNDLLRMILRKDTGRDFNPSAKWGKFNSDSEDLYSMATGR